MFVPTFGPSFFVFLWSNTPYFRWVRLFNGKTETIAVHAVTCLWYAATGVKPVTVILIRDKSKTDLT